jgi:hypothetical protein
VDNPWHIANTSSNITINVHSQTIHHSCD